MLDNYTQAANNRCFGVFDHDISSVWDDIENTPENTDADKWRKKLTQIAQEYSFSSRFALMRILYCQSKGIALTVKNPDTSSPFQANSPAEGVSFEVTIENTTYRFTDISMKHAQSLQPNELAQYRAVLMDKASCQAGFDDDPETAAYLISRALLDSVSAESAAVNRLPDDIQSDKAQLKKAVSGIRKQIKNLLSREEALQLGHILGLSLEEMNWFLLRVFDVDSAFRYSAAGDLIEAYGFITHASWQTVASLKEQYAAIESTVSKSDREEQAADWTQSVGTSLEGLASKWSPDTRDQEFIQWLTEKAPFLNLPSRTALRVYRNLAAYAYNLAVNQKFALDHDDFLPCIQEIAEAVDETDTARELFYDGDSVSDAKCSNAAGTLLFENLNLSLSNQTDRAKAWHVIVAQQNGAPTSTGGVNSSRKRVQDLLAGKIHVEKCDLMYLLWFTANLCWFSVEKPSQNDIFNRLADFTEAAECCLNAAMLPSFYPPHLMEQSMMLSIVCAGDSDPAETYEFICSSLIIPRKKRAKKKTR